MTSTYEPRFPFRRFCRDFFLWILPVTLVWISLTPIYNRFLAASTENLVRLFERPGVTHLFPRETHHLLITRTDRPARGSLYSVRTTDAHFHLILLGALFLAVPGVGAGDRVKNLAKASLLSVLFHIVLLFFWVQFAYATQMGDWSLANYGPVARNFWGLGKHLLDLPFKLALPLALWAYFYLRLLMPGEDGPVVSGRKRRRGSDGA